MATIQAAVRTLIESESQIINLLTGGVFDAAELGRVGLSPNTPGLYDAASRLKPAAVIRWRGAAQYGPHFAGERRFFEIYIYEDDGNAIIEEVKRLLKNLLHRRMVTADGGGLWWINWISDFGEMFRETELGGAAADFCRFEVIYTRG